MALSKRCCDDPIRRCTMPSMADVMGGGPVWERQRPLRPRESHPDRLSPGPLPIEYLADFSSESTRSSRARRAIAAWPTPFDVGFRVDFDVMAQPSWQR